MIRSLANNNRLYIFLLSLLLLYTLSLSGCAFISVSPFGITRPLKETVVSGEGKNKILLMDISGIISSKKKYALPFREKVSIVSLVREELKKAAQDKKIKGLILRINSPGGTVTASDIIYQEIKKFKQEKKIPVVACIMDVGASGGYYISLAADTIIAHPTSITGSIGVIAFKFNAKKLMGKIGIEDESIKSGDKKDLWSPFRPNTIEEKRILKQIISNLYQRFIEVVGEERKELTIEQVKKLADGRIYTAEQAVEAKLIDRIGYLDDAIEVTKRKANIKEASVIIYHRPISYKNNIYSQTLNSDIKSINFINIDLGTLTENVGLKLMYLWFP